MFWNLQVLVHKQARCCMSCDDYIGQNVSKLFGGCLWIDNIHLHRQTFGKQNSIMEDADFNTWNDLLPTEDSVLGKKDTIITLSILVKQVLEIQQL